MQTFSEHFLLEAPVISSHRQAVAIIPRGQRATELLNVSCGTQSISPLYLGTQNSWVTKDIKWILNGY